MLRKRIEQKIQNVVGLKENPVNFLQPVGDPGLFGPKSMVWQVHSDFSAMLVGGIVALYLQMLHPQVLAGVWDHSNFQQDLSGRLKRTAQFVSAVSFGPTEPALQFIEKVISIHKSIKGITEQGIPYTAEDPELLLWVHATQCFGYLEAYKRYRTPTLTATQETQYLQEYQRILVALGGPAIDWRSYKDLDQYLSSKQGQLLVDHRVKTTYDILRLEGAKTQNQRWLGGLFFDAALDLVPVWGQAMFDYHPSFLGQKLRTQSIHRIAQLLRWASTDSAVKRARRRVGVEN